MSGIHRLPAYHPRRTLQPLPGVRWPLMGLLTHLLIHPVHPPRTAKQNASHQSVPPLNGRINLAPEAIRANGQRAGVALDASVRNPSLKPSLEEGKSSKELQSQKVNGYSVTVNWIPQSPEEQQAIRAEIAKIVAQSI